MVSAEEQCIVVGRSSSSISTAIIVFVVSRGKPVFQSCRCRVSTSLQSLCTADERTVGTHVSTVPATRWHWHTTDRLGKIAELAGTISAAVGQSNELML